MPRGQNHSRKPTQKQRERMRRRGKSAGTDYCGCCPPRKHPTLDWCMGCQKRLRVTPVAKGYAP